ncbi:putative mitochondrial p-glycoprotein [Leptomonas pyrrhocoris]|uniref:Putative mitochondrial p-glycoprotein n=1 Tax=Leptomonas pyrrhocoris TaxID=157538 RepID=A0A0M9G4M1_LEPPY|nr:putative mitochondrial p-glycoprotein [Leptomonas pyrrhocoris]KPA82147.1 putative mitochondrial p-glycoprotein [Leptomonas pyrrhocoris]|eukprot:XP_015660586.1 putative mitochondrial p-glycoprotein [Leptomonas pyrrhocoris]
MRASEPTSDDAHAPLGNRGNEDEVSATSRVNQDRPSVFSREPDRLQPGEVESQLSSNAHFGQRANSGGGCFQGEKDAVAAVLGEKKSRSTSDLSPTSSYLKKSSESDSDSDVMRAAFSAEEIIKPTGKNECVSFFGIFRYADRADKALMIVGIFCAVVCGGGLPAFSFVFGRILNDLLVSNDPVKATSSTALIMVYIGIGVFVVCGGHVLCWTIAASRQMARIRLRFFEAALRQDIGWHDEHSPGELTARMTGDTRVIQNGINDKLSQGVMNASMGLLGFIFGFVFCWELTLVMLGMMPFIAIMGAAIGSIMAKMTEQTRKHFAKAGSMATEVMENIRTVQTFGKEEYETQRFGESVLEAQKKGIRKEFISTGSAGIIMALVFITYTIAFFFASYLVQWGRVEMKGVISTFLSVLIGSFGLGFVAPSTTAFAESRAAAYEIFKAIDRVPPVDIDAGGVPVTGFRDSIEFRSVKFAYPTRPDMMLFRDLSLTIKCGQKVAFSGASGCGKSSMIGLVQRFYDPLGGAVLCDGVDMRELCLRDWRDQIGIVSQEPNLFAGTMMENVRVGKVDATEEEVIEACRQANIHDTIMSLPDQYNTSVGAVGSQLSGGQKQRIAIARALVKRPPILLLDEATSALDRKSELEVQGALDQLMLKGGMTVIIIAHRLATIRDVDCIYYVKYDGVEGSKITESGTFDELMAMGGEFAAMAKIQGVPADGGRAGGKSETAKAKKDLLNVILDEAALAKLDAEAPRTERQKVPIEILAKWEVKQAKVGFRRLMQMNKDKTWAIILGFIGSALTGASGPVNAILFGEVLGVLGYYQVDKDVKALRSGTNLYAPLFMVFAASTFLGWSLQGFYGYAGEHLTTKIRVLLFRQILRQDMSFFDIPGRDAGTLAGMLSGDCEAVHQLWGPSIGLKVQTACSVAAGLIVGFVYQWKLAFVALACMPVVALCNLLQRRLMMGYTQKKEGDSDDTIVTEALSNVRTVTSFNLKDDRVRAFKEILDDETPREVKKGIVVGVLYGISQFVFYGVFALCFWYGGKLIKKGEANFQEVVISSMSVLMGAMGAGEAGGFATKLADAEKATARVFSVIDRVPDVDPYSRGDEELGEGCDINFRKVQFIYPARPKQVVLASVDLNFADSTTNGLMGQTGCGKSTIIQMLARFYDRRSGLITVNGKDISTLDIEEWRRNISIVLQEPNLFSGTVRENIRYARSDATDDEVEEAAKLAHIHHEIVKWPEGYDTDVGYKGRALSGGQKQRVAIARGLLRRPKLLLLDEATSALDNVTEAKVQKGIDAFQTKYGITTVSVAHRLTTIRNCDQIILLDTGHIIEEGNHDELMRLNGEYKTRWELYNSATSS